MFNPLAPDLFVSEVSRGYRQSRLQAKSAERVDRTLGVVRHQINDHIEIDCGAQIPMQRDSDSTHHDVAHLCPGQRGEYVQVRVHMSDGTAPVPDEGAPASADAPSAETASRC